MTDRPILFSAPMVRAIIRECQQPGTGKTQTRRVLKPQPITPECWDGQWVCAHRERVSGSMDGERSITPYTPGDRLWVRETWTATGTGVWTIADARLRAAPDQRIVYRADGQPFLDRSWPAIHMPREFSRLTLNVTGVRVQRLQEISEDDAKAEGVQIEETLPHDVHRCWLDLGHDSKGAEWITSWDAKDVFRQLWFSIHGPGAWEANPWVVAVSFLPALRNIDTRSRQMEAAG